MKEPTLFEQFRENLYGENLRGAWELESLNFGIMARIGLSEPDALELACRIVATKPSIEYVDGKPGYTATCVNGASEKA